MKLSEYLNNIVDEVLNSDENIESIDIEVGVGKRDYGNDSARLIALPENAYGKFKCRIQIKNEEIKNE